MINLIRMDLYRINKNRAFWTCLILAMASAFIQTPLAWLLYRVGSMFSDEISAFPEKAMLSEIIADPFPLLNATLAMISACSFFYADVENGYIKNIAGQMPMRGYTVLSKFVAVIPHNIVFMLAALICNLIGTILFQKIDVDAGVLNQIGMFFLKLLLFQSLCAILLLVTSTLRSKSLGSVLSVLLGTGILFLAYMAIESGIEQLFNLENFSISKYMPDQLLRDTSPKPLTAILSALVTGAVFLILAVRIFDRRDVK